MKRIMILVSVFICFIGIGKVDALSYYESVNINVAFTEDIDIKTIELVKATILFPNGKQENLNLFKSENFSKTYNNIPKGEIKFMYGHIEDDLIAKFLVTGKTIKYVDDSSIDLKIIVEKNNSVGTSQVNLTDDQLNIISGGRVEADPFYNRKIKLNDLGEFEYADVVTTTTTTSPVISSVSGEETTSLNDETTSTDAVKTSVIITEKTTKKQEEVDSEETEEKNDKIRKIMIIIMLSIVGVAVLYISVKIMKANK